MIALYAFAAIAGAIVGAVAMLFVKDTHYCPVCGKFTEQCGKPCQLCKPVVDPSAQAKVDETIRRGRWLG